MFIEFLMGIFIGYFVISISESFFHRNIQHAPPKIRKLIRRMGAVGSAYISAWYSHHVVHHYLTFRKNHVTQFTSKTERQNLDLELFERSESRIITASYGSRIGPYFKDYVWYVLPTLPGFLLLCWIGGLSFTIGALIPFFVWPALAQAIHPYLHMEYTRVQKQAPPIVRIFSKTYYFRYLAMHHWMHHRYEQCNYNLLLGGDFILGVHRTPSVADLAEMQALGLWTPPSARLQAHTSAQP